MLKNHIKIAWRTLQKNKAYASINILGLALGISIALIIGMWINSELRFDRFYSKADRLSQVYTLDTFEGQAHTWGATPSVLGPVLQQDHPEIEAVVRTGDVHQILHVDNERFRAAGVASDPAFFDLFDFKVLAGNSAKALAEPNSIVLTASLAQKLFGTESAIGKTVHIDDLASMQVQAVIQDIPSNSSFSGKDFFCAWNFLKVAGWGGLDENSSWTNYNHKTYVLLKENSELSSVNQNIKNLVQKHTNNKTKATIYLYPAERWHLYNKSENGQMLAGNLVTVQLFALIGFFILLIACINFINLSTASAERRAKEVGVRKVVGAPKQALIAQFLLESLLLTLCAGILAIAITALAIPYFNSFIGAVIGISGQETVFWSLFIGIILFTALAAGIYPAFVLSSFEPIKTLKGNVASFRQGFKPRQVLVAMQFTISICLGICTLIIAQQIRHGQERDKGYNQQDLVYAALDGELGKNYSLIRSELLEKGIASHVSKTLGRITHYASNSWGFSWPESKPEDSDVVFNIMSSDADFTQTMGIKLLAGRDIDGYTYATDSTAVLLNEAAVKRMGLSDPIGAEIIASKGTEYEERLHVVGVIQDFIWTSPFATIDPMMVKGPASWFGFIHVRFNTKNSLVNNMEGLEAILKKYNPQDPISIRFADEAYASKFVYEKRTATLTAIFAGLAIFIAALGLLGLVSYATMQRQKEIGIRKVLGASVVGIVAMLSKDFLRLVIIAILIASPIAWWLMQKWLADFVYRISIHWWTFALAGLFAICLALFTVSGLAIRAARNNPVNSLRDE